MAFSQAEAQRTARQLYIDILGRDPGNNTSGWPEYLIGKANELGSNAAAVEAMRQGLYNSPEYKSKMAAKEKPLTDPTVDETPAVAQAKQTSTTATSPTATPKVQTTATTTSAPPVTAKPPLDSGMFSGLFPAEVMGVPFKYVVMAIIAVIVYYKFIK